MIRIVNHRWSNIVAWHVSNQVSSRYFSLSGRGFSHWTIMVIWCEVSLCVIFPQFNYVFSPIYWQTFFFLGLVRILWCCSPFRDEWTRAGLPLNALSVLLMDSAITRTHTLINIQSRLWLIRIETIDFCPPRLSREITDGFIIWGKEERMTAPGRTLHERRRWWSMCVIIKWRRRSGNVETNK